MTKEGGGLLDYANVICLPQMKANNKRRLGWEN
jgi:hypothetical protein